MNGINKILSDIKSLKIQGATNVAIAGVEAYMSKPSTKLRDKILSIRPTEPLLENSLKMIEKGMSISFIMGHFQNSQNVINDSTFKIIKNYRGIFTHCHSSTVVNALIYSKKKKASFRVYNTETRPLYQGRQTARELSLNKIDATIFVDSGMHEAIEKADVALIGADAILREGVINKIGSEVMADICYIHKKPIYVLSDSWKFTDKNIKIEERNPEEVWKGAPKGIKIRNPAFEKIPKKFIKGIISEFGLLNYSEFIKRAERINF